ncbi:MAG TPA: 2-succinyl-5-enolpyruvyl-6-hydroxy-3-cyclohexene-1-carboxylic-acid synthase [Ignavibacteriaceae bacterium]|nr:2-succinyl-5-enolpyruvyl-6-hydroxy-3-cyclohexene-1-carboxylic-acid synthase [Ignavibacteriaceae bacterium]
MKINRNILWSENFFNRLADLGVRFACISPGSRSTALTLSAASNKKFKCFVNIDERSSAFFALGLAKASRTPVIIITTSGTAVAEIYPAVIEAFQQRIPLIVCTADRPQELIGRGANQTINQNNIYANHIIFFKDAGLPSATISGLSKIRRLAERSFIYSQQGPVHINFPFRKPFEPDSYTDEINNKDLKIFETYKLRETIPLVKDKSHNTNLLNEILNYMKKSKRGLIIAGPMQYEANEKQGLIKLSEHLNFPILADASSQLRFGSGSKKNLLINYEGFLKNKLFVEKYFPDLILQFGSTPSSKAIESYLFTHSSKRYIINKYGDIFDPWNSASGILKCAPSLFCKLVLERVSPLEKNQENVLFRADNLSNKIKEKVLKDSLFPNECRLISEIIKSLPDDIQLIISNSMPVRDFDYFAPLTDKNIYVHTNRGASGIDGIISTSLGIQKGLQKPTLLITGDLAFLYDLNSLAAADKYKIPLVVVLINNNGGGIFSMLPVSRYGKKFSEYFTSPHYLNFNSITKSFRGNYKLIRSWDDLRISVRNALSKKTFSVLEIKTKIKISVNIRRKYFTEANRIIGKNIL